MKFTRPHGLWIVGLCRISNEEGRLRAHIRSATNAETHGLDQRKNVCAVAGIEL